LTKTCKDGCQRKSTHKKYNADIVAAIHSYLDKCQVPPNPAPGPAHTDG